MVNNKKENEEENTSNDYSANHKKKGTFKKFKGPKKNMDLSKVECYNCHKMGHYQSHCPKKPRNKKRNRDQVNVVDEAPSKKNKTEEESKVKDLYY